MRVLRVLVAAAVVAGVSGCGDVGAASIEFVEITPKNPRISDVVTVRVRAVDSRGIPQAGANVTFKVLSSSTSPGVEVTPAQVLSNKGSGIAETQLVVKGTRVNSVVLEVTSGDKKILTPAISFAGSTANGRQLTFQCGEIAGKASGGVHAIGAFDESRSLIAGVKLKCTAHVGDRNGDGVTDSLVTFLTEAGTIGPSETSATDIIGNATILYKTSLPLPRDVAPGKFVFTSGKDTGEFLAPLWMLPFQWRQNPGLAAGNPTGDEPRRTDPVRKSGANQALTNNPRDNLVTLIAVTAGEEGFTDNNNNGRFDDGDGFDAADDMPEPFIDENDNGIYDPPPIAERYIDANGNGSWDQANGKWDANTLIWRMERILWTGIPLVSPIGNDDTSAPQPTIVTVQPSTGIALTCPNTAMPGAGVLCGLGGGGAANPVAVVAFVADPWYNSIAQDGEQDGCFAVVQEKPLVIINPKFLNPGFPLTYPAGRPISFELTDARDPAASVETAVPKRTPTRFTQSVACTYTSSPEGGNKISVNIGTMRGTIE